MCFIWLARRTRMETGSPSRLDLVMQLGKHALGSHGSHDCLDRILILGRRHLEHVLRVYRRHYNEHRPHRALRLIPPDGRDPTPLEVTARLRRRDLLGGLIHEYQAA